jgi:hypothetical protein
VRGEIRFRVRSFLARPTLLRRAGRTRMLAASFFVPLRGAGRQRRSIGVRGEIRFRVRSFFSGACAPYGEPNASASALSP